MSLSHSFPINAWRYHCNHVLSHLLQRRAALTVLITAIILSAFAVVYIQDAHRRLLIEKQRLEINYRRLQIEKGKRLLEKGVLASEARIEQRAGRLLNMRMPNAADITLIHLK